MLIDWFTVGAQALNFLILVWLLKRFLYRPVLAAIDAREQKIARQLESAAKQEAQARAERDDFQRRNSALDQERAKVLRDASEAATRERDRLLESAREDARTLRERLSEVLANERDELRRRLQSQTRLEVFALTRRVLQDLSGVEVEQRMVEVFLTHLRGLAAGQRQEILRPLAAPGRAARGFSAIVRSAFELSPTQQATLESAVAETLGRPDSIRFEITPELICGIELSVDGVKLAWSIPDYLGSVSQSLLALIEPESADPEPLREAQHG